jgi:hypothetical protein
MASKSSLMTQFAVSKDVPLRTSAGDDHLAELMASPEYLRHSSAVINEALKEGFDVLQLPSGDIVTTGTRIIVNNFTWDAAKKKFVKSRAGAEKSATQLTVDG